MSASGNLSRILVAIDGSTNSMRAADAAIFTAKKAGAKLLSLIFCFVKISNRKNAEIVIPFRTNHNR